MKTVDPDLLASQKPADLDLHCFQNGITRICIVIVNFALVLNEKKCSKILTILYQVNMQYSGERSGSVVECLTRDRRAAGSSLTGITALWSLSKTHLS